MHARPDAAPEPPRVLGGVLGIDPGIRATGWGILSLATDGVVRLVWGVVWPKADSLAERLSQIQLGIGDVIARHQPVAAAVERPFVRHNVRTAVMLGQAAAAAMIAASQADIEIIEYPPRTVREAVVGDGAADKQAVARALVSRLQLERLEASNDAADALAVAYCHVLVSQGFGSTPRIASAS